METHKQQRAGRAEETATRGTRTATGNTKYRTSMKDNIRASIQRLRGKLFQADRRTREGRELAESLEYLERTFRRTYGEAA